VALLALSGLEGRNQRRKPGQYSPSGKPNSNALRSLQKLASNATITEKSYRHLTGIYRAEDYQQDFLVHHTSYAYSVQNDLPKIANLKRLFPQLYRDQPMLVHRRQE